MIRKSWTIVGVSVGALWACGGRSMSALERPSDGDSSASAGSAHQAMGAAGGGQASRKGGSAQAGGDSTGDNGGSARAGGDSTGDNGGSAQAGGDSTGVGSAGTAGRVAGIGGQADLGATGGQGVTGADGLRASYSFDETSGSTATETLSQARVPIYFASRVEGVVGNALGFGAPSARVEALPVGSFPTG